jgi:hypothetical protein
MNSAPSVLSGSQTPRLCSVPPHDTSAGPDAIQYAASVGLKLDPWQELVLEGALGERGPVWSALEVGLVVGRQNGKGAVLEARELAGIMLFGERLIVHTSHELKTSNEAQLRMDEIIESSPDLDRACLSSLKANGKEQIKFRGGARIKYIARSRGSGRGFSGDCVIFDEAMFLDALFMDALMPTLSARPNPQLWYTGSAGFLDSTQLQRVRARGSSGTDPELAYFEWSALEGSDLDDRHAWEQANPALGIRLSERFMWAERRALTEAGFARERLGLWEEEDTARILDLDTWLALVDPTDPVGHLAIGVDVAQDRSAATIGVAWRGEDEYVHVDVLDRRPSTSWVVDRLVELQALKPLRVALDPAGNVGALLPELNEAGIETTTLGARELAQACGGFYDDVNEGRIRHSGDDSLDAAVAAATRKPVGDAWRWKRSDGTDLSPLYATTIARFAFIDADIEAPSAYEERPMVTL